MLPYRYSISAASKPLTWALSLILVVSLSSLMGSGVFQGAACPVPSPRSAMDNATAQCTFSNPSYSGLCRESAPLKEGESADDACSGILQCLNNVRCQKNYCGSTSIREGWKLDSAKASSEMK